jgi:hypothetical protein
MGGSTLPYRLLQLLHSRVSKNTRFRNAVSQKYIRAFDTSTAVMQTFPCYFPIETNVQGLETFSNGAEEIPPREETFMI